MYANWLLHCGRDLWLTLFDPSRFALTTAQVEQPRPAYLTHTNDVNFVDVGRQNRKNPLYTNAIRYFADGERFATAARIPALNNRSGENLNALFVAFPDFDVYVNRITRPESRQVGATLRVVCLY